MNWTALVVEARKAGWGGIRGPERREESAGSGGSGGYLCGAEQRQAAQPSQRARRVHAPTRTEQPVPSLRAAHAEPAPAHAPGPLQSTDDAAAEPMPHGERG